MLSRGQDGYYTNREGKKYPSVTTVISEFLSDFSHIDPEVLERACRYGSAVHSATALNDADDLDWQSLDENLKPSILAWDICKNQNKIVIKEIEKIVFSEKFGYAGQLDRIAEVDGELSLIELKTRKYNSKTDNLQTAAYMMAYQEMHPKIKIKNRFLCELKLDGKFSFKKIGGEIDFDFFLNCLTLFKYKNKIKKGAD